MMQRQIERKEELTRRERAVLRYAKKSEVKGVKIKKKIKVLCGVLMGMEPIVGMTVKDARDELKTAYNIPNGAISVVITDEGKLIEDDDSHKLEETDRLEFIKFSGSKGFLGNKNWSVWEDEFNKYISISDLLKDDMGIKGEQSGKKEKKKYKDNPEMRKVFEALCFCDLDNCFQPEEDFSDVFCSPVVEEISRLAAAPVHTLMLYKDDSVAFPLTVAALLLFGLFLGKLLYDPAMRIRYMKDLNAKDNFNIRMEGDKYKG